MQALEAAGLGYYASRILAVDAGGAAWEVTVSAPLTIRAIPGIRRGTTSVNLFGGGDNTPVKDSGRLGDPLGTGTVATVSVDWIEATVFP